MNRPFTACALALGLSISALSLGAAPAMAQAVPTVVEITKPAAGTPIMVVLPTSELGMLTAAGTTEPKEEWSKNAQKYLDAALTTAINTKSYKAVNVDVSTNEDPAALQVLKLNDVVTQSIQYNFYVKLPTKPSFDWTLGEGAAKIIPASVDPTAPAPAYALFVNAQGRYQSGGRAAVNVAMAMLGGPIVTGMQIMTGTLVDLKTGQVVWYQMMVVPSGTDIRTAEGAGSAVNILLKKLPL